MQTGSQDRLQPLRFFQTIRPARQRSPQRQGDQTRPQAVQHPRNEGGSLHLHETTRQGLRRPANILRFRHDDNTCHLTVRECPENQVADLQPQL